MSRLKAYLHSAASGHLALLANTGYTLASVPLALAYLDTETFGLWIYVSQINIYLSLLDLGTTPAITRLLVDHKDDRQGERYGTMVRTSWLVSSVQGLILLMVGALLPPYCASWLGVPPGAVREFAWLVVSLSAIQAVTFGTKIFAHLLEAHQKQFISNYASMFGFAGAYVAMSLGLHAGLGIRSMVVAMATYTLVVIGTTLGGVIHHRLLPDRERRGTVSSQAFHEIFALSRDTFLIVVGSSVIMGGQTIIIGRYIGLTAAAYWTVGTKIFSLLTQLLCRLFDASLPALAEMIRRGEADKLRQRFSDLVRAITVVVVVVAVSLAITNTSFVSVWTGNKVKWNATCDGLLALWLVVIAFAHCHGMFILATKQLRLMKYVFIVEGIVSVVLARMVAPSLGIPGVILTSIICALLFHAPYTVWRTMHYFHGCFSAFTRHWCRPAAASLVIMLPVAFIVWYLTRGASLQQQFIWRISVSSMTGGLLILVFGLSGTAKAEVLRAFRQIAAAVAARLTPH